MSKPIFWEKIKVPSVSTNKSTISLLSAEFAHRVVKVKYLENLI